MATPPVAPRDEDVLAVIRRHPNGATLEQIEKELSPAPQRRMLQYSVRVLEEHHKIANVGTARAPVYRVSADLSAPDAAVTPAASAAASPARQPMSAQPSAAASGPAVEQRLGATAIAVDPEQVNELADLIIAAHVPDVAVKPYIRQAARGLPNPSEFIAAVEAELARRR